MNGKDIIKEAGKQALGRESVNGIQVMGYLFRHVGYLFFLTPVIVSLLAVVWAMYFEPKVRRVAKEEDKPIIIKVDTLESSVKKIKKTQAETYFDVKTMMSIQERTSPKRIVDEVKEKIIIEKNAAKIAGD
jgi:hypothetical protein